MQDIYNLCDAIVETINNGIAAGWDGSNPTLAYNAQQKLASQLKSLSLQIIDEAREAV